MNFINKQNFFITVILIYSLYDRTLWSNIAQWQVDEATTMWLGLTYPLSDAPVGLISSQDIPNPNGMIYLSKFLNKFSNLWYASYVLSLIQLILIFLLTYFLAKDNKKLFFIIIAPLIFSVCLRSISSHMSNQWVLTLVNLLFFILLIIYVNKPSLEKLILLILPIIIAPSIYLSGITNSAAYLLCIIFILFFYPLKITFNKSYKSILLLFSIILIFFIAVWFPYIKVVILHDIEFFNNNNSLSNKLIEVIHTIKNFPYWSIFYAAADLSGAFKHNGLDNSPFWSIFHFNEENREIFKNFYDGPLSTNSIYLLKINSLILTIQSILSSIILIYLFIFFLLKKFDRIINKKITIFLITMYLFVFFIVILGAFLGSPEWIKGKRLDMQVHLLPFLLLIWFLTPWILKIPTKFEKYFKGISLVLLLSFIVINIFVGQIIYKDHINYRGNIISDADIPLVHKQKIIEFIVEDWNKTSTQKNIEIGYFFTDKRYGWIDKFGEKYKNFYPNVYTRGREYDYILLKSHGIYNNQEGIQHRKKLENQYIITYLDTKISNKKNSIIVLKQIGRLKVYKVKNY